jgi:hypothetical protein
MCNPAIELIAGVHILYFYRFRNVFSRYRVDSGITHQKSPAHSLEFRGFLQNIIWQIFKAGCTTKYIYTWRTTVSVPSSELGLPTPSPARNLTGWGVPIQTTGEKA